MQFPITRTQLQNFDFIKEQEERRFNEMMDRFITAFNNYMVSSQSRNKTQYIEYGVRVRYGSSLNRFIEKLREMFIDCRIIIDPLESYVIIDWS